MDLKRTMIHVVLAMQLAFIAGVVNIGHQHYTAFGMYAGAFLGIGWKFAYGLLQMLPLIIVVHVVGLGIEFFFAAKKGHSIEEGFLVSAFLIPMIMPPDVPLWMVAIATAFAVIVAKEAFGGTGMNILNIALTAPKTIESIMRQLPIPDTARMRAPAITASLFISPMEPGITPISKFVVEYC